jgi:membrane fusion protein, multidrug efflux system
VELDVDNSLGLIIAGSYAQVSFNDIHAKPPVVIPANTLLFRAEGPQVGVVLPNGKVELRSLEVGRDLGQNIEVISGLRTNELVIINPSDSLVSGLEVRPVEDGSAYKP